VQLTPFIGAAIVGAVAPFLRALVWGVPFTHLSWGMALRVTIGAGLVTLLAGLISLIAFESNIASLIGLWVGAVLTLLSARRSRHTRGTALLAYRLTQEPTREEARAVLRKRFERYAGGSLSATEHARLAPVAVLPLSALGIWDDALAILRGVDRTQLGRLDAARHGQALATCLMEQGHLEEAAAIIGELERPAVIEIERWLIALEALLAAVQGGSEQALALAREHDDGEGALGASYAIVRSHAYACEGAERECQRELDKVIELAGPDALIRAVRPLGPASDLAREMMVERGQATRVAADES
jgi:hypothetical protein